MKDTITIIRSNAGLISILGALIIFFSWVVSNTFKTKYTNLNSAIASAERDARIFGALGELAGSVNSVASEIVQPKLLEQTRLGYEEHTLGTLRSRSYRILQNTFSSLSDS